MEERTVLYTFTVERLAPYSYVARCHELPELKATAGNQRQAVVKAAELVTELARGGLGHAAARNA